MEVVIVLLSKIYSASDATRIHSWDSLRTMMKSLKVNEAQRRLRVGMTFALPNPIAFYEVHQTQVEASAQEVRVGRRDE